PIGAATLDTASSCTPSDFDPRARRSGDPPALGVISINANGSLALPGKGRAREPCIRGASRAPGVRDRPSISGPGQAPYSSQEGELPQYWLKYPTGTWKSNRNAIRSVPS